MNKALTAIEITGSIDEHHQLHLDLPLTLTGPMRVKVIVLYPLAEEISEVEWLHAAARNPAFAYLSEPEENIYTPADGKPFNDQA